MNYALLVPFQVIRTISPEQYNRLRATNKAQGNQYKKTIITDYATYEKEKEEARAYSHAQHHKTNTTKERHQITFIQYSTKRINKRIVAIKVK